MSAQYSFSFHEGDGKNKALLGGKGANLYVSFSSPRIPIARLAAAYAKLLEGE